MRKRSWVAGALPFILTVLVAGCGGGASPEGPERRFLSLGTAPPGGAFFVVGGAIAEVLNEYGPEGWQVTAEATKGSQENIRRLATGELDLALANAAISYFAVRGEGEWDRAYPIRTVMTLAPNVALFITRPTRASSGSPIWRAAGSWWARRAPASSTSWARSWPPTG